MQSLISFEVGSPTLLSRWEANKIFAAEVCGYDQQRLVRRARVLFLVAEGVASVLGSHLENVRNAKLPASQKALSSGCERRMIVTTQAKGSWPSCTRGTSTGT